MRRFFISLLAFLGATMAGGLVAQVLAEWTRATEEYILVFAATMLFAMLITVPFFIAQFFQDPRRALDRVATWSVALLVLILAGLLIWTLSLPAEQRGSGGDFKIIAGFILPNVTTILAHWLIVRAFHGGAGTVQFGRRQGM